MGDFVANFHRPETGIQTVEGNVAGSRAAHLSRKRELQQQEFESRAAKLRQDTARESKGMEEKFQNIATTEDQVFKERTVGLVTAEEFKRAAAGIGDSSKEEQERILAEEEEEVKKALEEEMVRKKEKKKRDKMRKKQLCALSFAGEEEPEGNDGPEDSTNATNMMGWIKNPDVDTSCLPDKQREQEREAERQRLKSEWIAKQQQMKNEKLEITYSYWDGTGHRRIVRVRKGDTIGQTLRTGSTRFGQGIP